MVYRNDLDQQFAASTPCIPFLGVFLTQIVQQESYSQCKPKRGGVIRKHSAGLENYTILEAITARNQLEKLAHQHSVHKRERKHIPCIGSSHKETDRSDPKSDDHTSYCFHNRLQEEIQSPLTPVHSAIAQPVKHSEQHLEGESQRVPLQNLERVSGPFQLSQSTVVAVRPCRTNRAKPCRLIRDKSMSDHALDVAGVATKSNNIIDFAGVHSQSLESLQDSESSSIVSSRSSSNSGDSLDSLSSDEEQIPIFKFPPSFDATMSLPISSGGQLSPYSLASSTCICNTKRRSTMVVLKLYLVQMSRSTSPSDLLQKYQFHSLGCCRGVESRAKLRALLTDTAHNTEGQNYKLSYQREPQ